MWYNVNENNEAVKSDGGKDMFSTACGVDPNEKYFIYVTAQKGEAYVYNLETNEEKKLRDGVSLRETIGFDESVMYAQGTDRSVVSVNPETGIVKTEADNPKLNL